jgi:hypothetical protein
MTDVYCQLIPSYVNRESTYILASYPPATARNAHLCRDVNVNSALWIRFIHPVSVLLVFEIYEALSEKKKCVVGTVMTTLSSLIEEDKDVFDKLEYTPSNPLKEATEYIVHIEYVMDESESGNDKHIISFTYRFFTVNYKFPRIVDTFPYHLTENVSIVQPVYIKFDHPVLINNFVCNVDVYPPHQFSVHPDSSNPAVIILVPILPLLPNTVYFIKIGKWVYDYYFKRMLDSVFFSFKTGDYFIDLRYLSMDDGIDLNGIRNLISHSHEQSSSNSLFFKYLTRKGCLNLGLKHDFKYIGIKKEDSFEDSIISLEHTDEFKSKSYYPLLIYSSPCVDDRILSILRSPVSPKQSSFSFQFGLPQFSFSALFSIRHRYLLSYYGFMVVDDEKNNKINLKARQKKKSSLLLLLARPPAETLASYLRHVFIFLYFTFFFFYFAIFISN